MSTKIIPRGGVGGNVAETERRNGRHGGAAKAPGARIPSNGVLTPEAGSGAPPAGRLELSPEAIRWQRNRLEQILRFRESRGEGFATVEELGAWLGYHLADAEVEYRRHQEREARLVAERAERWRRLAEEI